MPSTNKKGPINIPPGTDSKNPAKYTGMLNLSNIFKDVDKFKNSLDPKHPSYQGNLPGESKFGVLPGLDAKTIGVTEDESEGGKGNEIVKNLNDKKDYGKLSISGTKRFNYLQKLYNKVKDIPGVENNPKFHKLVKKLSRKYPRMINRLERAKESSEKVRQQTANELSTNPEVASITEITTSGMDAWNNFNKNVWSKKNYSVDIQTNEDDKLGGKVQVETNEQRGENLGPRLGSNISAALKNKKW